MDIFVHGSDDITHIIKPYFGSLKGNVKSAFRNLGVQNYFSTMSSTFKI